MTIPGRKGAGIRSRGDITNSRIGIAGTLGKTTKKSMVEASRWVKDQRIHETSGTVGEQNGCQIGDLGVGQEWDSIGAGQ